MNGTLTLSVVYKMHKSRKARQTGCDHSDKCLRTRGHKLKTSSKKQKFNQKCVCLLTLTDRYRPGSPTLSGFRQKCATRSCSFKFTPRLYQLIKIWGHGSIDWHGKEKKEQHLTGYRLSEAERTRPDQTRSCIYSEDTRKCDIHYSHTSSHKGECNSIGPAHKQMVDRQ